MAKKKRPAKKTGAAKKPATAKPAPVAAGELIRDDIPCDDGIDPMYADAVRAGRPEQWVRKYTEAVEAGADLPPIDVFVWEGGSVFLLADGSYRVAAYRAAGKKKIPATIHVMPTEAAARQAALLHAAQSNESHGVPRTDEDKWLAVTTILTDPGHSALSDSRVGRLCRVHHAFVRRVREKRSAEGDIPADSAAHSSRKNYKPNASYGGGRRHDGKGGVKPCPLRAGPVADPAAAGCVSPNPPEGGCADRELCEQRDRQESDRSDSPESEPRHVTTPEPTSEPSHVTGQGSRSDCSDSTPGRGRSKSDERRGRVVLDRLGRPVPEQYVAVFTAGCEWFRVMDSDLKVWADAVREAHSRPWGLGLPALDNSLSIDLRDLRVSLKSAAPYCLCPHLRDDGTHEAAACQVCGGSASPRGWLTEALFDQLPRELQSVCKAHGGKEAA